MAKSSLDIFQTGMVNSFCSNSILTKGEAHFMSIDIYCNNELGSATGIGGAALPCWSALTAW
jgi:hypothetical protein